MPKVRATELVFHNNRRYRAGETYEVTDAQLAEAVKRFQTRKIKPCFALVPSPKPAPVDDIA